MSPDAMSLEEHLVPPARWDVEVPPEVRLHGIEDEGSYPVGYGRHPEKGWFVLGTGQGPFVIWAEWENEPVKQFGFTAPTEEPRYRRPLVDALTRLQKALQNTGPQP
jgi:hypothetical protein